MGFNNLIDNVGSSNTIIGSFNNKLNTKINNQIIIGNNIDGDINDKFILSNLLKINNRFEIYGNLKIKDIIFKKGKIDCKNLIFDNIDIINNIIKSPLSLKINYDIGNIYTINIIKDDISIIYLPEIQLNSYIYYKNLKITPTKLIGKNEEYILLNQNSCICLLSIEESKWIKISEFFGSNNPKYECIL